MHGVQNMTNEEASAMKEKDYGKAVHAIMYRDLYTQYGVTMQLLLEILELVK